MGRYILEVEDFFSSAHNLRDYEGKCENLHGHNWKVRVYVSGEKLDNSGMLLDFKILKRELRRIIDYLDHRYLNEVEPFDRINPSSENIAKFIFEKLQEALSQYNVAVERVTVYESEGTGASYEE